MKTHTLALVIALSCSSIGLADENLLREAAKREFGGSGEDGCELVIQHAVKLGINYRTLVDGCVQDKDPVLKKRSLSLMLWFSAFGGLDGAIAQGHAAVIGSLVKRLGDEAFSKLVEGEPRAMRKAALSDVNYDFGVGEDPKEDATEDKRKILQEYAKTFRALAAPEHLNKDKAEQAAP